MSDELVEIATDSVRGGVQLFSGKAISLVVLTIGSIIIARLLGPEGYGIFSLALVVPGILIALVDIGVRHSITRYLAVYAKRDEESAATSLLRTGLLLQIGLGFTASLAGIVFADHFATLLNRPRISTLIQLASAVIFFQLLFLTLNSTFFGLNRMERSAVLLNAQALAKSTLAPILVVLGFGVFGAILGHILGYAIATMVGVGAFLPMYFKAFGKPSKQIVRNDVKTILRYSTPLYLASLLIMLQGQSQTILLAQFVSDSVIGNFAVATMLALSLGLLAYPFTSLFPAFSKMTPLTDDLKKMFRLSVRYSAMVIVPVAFAISLLSEQLVSLVYGHEYVLASKILSLYVLFYALAGFGSVVLTNMLRGLDRTKSVLAMGVVGFCSFIPLGFAGLVSLGVMGLVAGFLASQALAVMYGLKEAKKVGAEVDLRGSARIYSAALLSAVSLYGFLVLSPMNDSMNLLFGVLVYSLLYVTALPLTGAIRSSDFWNFRRSFQQNRLIWPILRVSIGYQRRILNIRHRHLHH